jgi:amino acid transporter
MSNPSSTASGTEPVTLRRVLRLPEVLMQSIGVIAPAAAVVFTVQLMAVYAGVAVPAALLISLIIMAALAFTLSQIARLLPSAGGYYTFVRAAFGPGSGLAVASVVLIYLLTPSMNSAYLSTVLQTQINASYGVNIPWQILFVVIILFTGALAYRGVSLSGRALLILGGLEIGILLAIGISGLVSPGPGGVSWRSLDPALAHNGIYLAVVFGMFFFAGWEGAAPIAEESADPVRTIPRALVGSVLVAGVVFIVTCWGLISGWGIRNVKTFATSTTLAPVTLAHHYWGGAWVVMLFALFNSVCAISLASTLVCTRMVYAISRIGVLPRWFATLHPTYRTPYRATLVGIGFSLAFGLIMGQTVGAVNSYYIYGLAFTLLIIVVYIAGNFAVTRYFRRQQPGSFSPWAHVVLPVLTTAALIYVGYRSVVPFPAYPVAAGVWLALGWIIVAGGLGILAHARRAAIDTDLAQVSAAEPTPPETATPQAGGS